MPGKSNGIVSGWLKHGEQGPMLDASKAPAASAYLPGSTSIGVAPT
jgi:hypothetical protein